MFVGFSQGVFSGATGFKTKGDFVFDIVDAGITQLLSDYFSGKIKNQSDIAGSMFYGSMNTAISKLASGLSDLATPPGGPVGEAILAAEMRLIFAMVLKMFEIR